MKLHISGFELAFHREVSKEDLLAELRGRRGQRFSFELHDRIIRIDESNAKYVVGRLSTDRGHKKFSQLDNQTNEMSVGDVEKGKTLSAFNFFLISKKTKYGLLTHYQESGGVKFFIRVLQDFGARALETMRNQALKGIGKHGSETEKRTIKDKYDGDAVDGQEVLSQEQYEAILRKWNKIGALELVYAVPKATAKYVPLDDIVQTTTVRTTFKRTSDFGERLNFVIRTVKGERPDKARVLGVNEFDAEARLDVFRGVPDWFGQLDYEKMIADKTIFASKLHDSCLVRHLINEASSRPALFG
jgi:hypothetical protein